MITYKLDANPKRTTLILEGTLDESFTLDSVINTPPATLYVDSYGLKRINSTGVKKWMICFNALRDKNVQLVFIRASAAIVEQCNLIHNFICGGTVESVSLPFICKSCNEPNVLVKEQHELKDVNLDQVSWPCAKCGKSELVFDDMGDTYLGFWNP